MFFHADDEVTRSSFGIWSLRWSPDGKEIIAGTGDSSLYIYDVESQRVSSLKAVADIFLPAFPAQAPLCSLLLGHWALCTCCIVCMFRPCWAANNADNVIIKHVIIKQCDAVLSSFIHSRTD